MWESDEADNLDDPSEVNEWGSYYDTNVDHEYLKEYMQKVANRLFFDLKKIVFLLMKFIINNLLI